MNPSTISCRVRCGKRGTTLFARKALVAAITGTLMSVRVLCVLCNRSTASVSPRAASKEKATNEFPSPSGLASPVLVYCLRDDGVGAAIEMRKRVSLANGAVDCAST